MLSSKPKSNCWRKVSRPLVIRAVRCNLKKTIQGNNSRDTILNFSGFQFPFFTHADRVYAYVIWNQESFEDRKVESTLYLYKFAPLLSMILKRLLSLFRVHFKMPRRLRSFCGFSRGPAHNISSHPSANRGCHTWYMYPHP
jgi:hypothetical protein